MRSDVLYTTKELSLKTWPDFEDLFSRGNGWDFCACMLNVRGRHLPLKQFPERAAMKARNMSDMHDLVRDDRSHGVLVYADGVPVGWCQFGTVDELPRWSTKLGYQPRESGETPHWRVTCFITDKAHRKAGVARLALRAAIAAITARGGGIVEAYPLVWEVDDTVSALLDDSMPPIANTWFRARQRGSNVPGGSSGAFGMFTDEGFWPVAAIPPGAHERRMKAPPQVVVRRTI